MRTFLPLIVLLASISASSAVATKERKLEDIKVIPPRVLKRMVSPKFYNTLLVSPVKGWIVVRGQLIGTKLTGARVVRSELGGKFNDLALKYANELHIQGNFTTGTLVRSSSVLVHLLVYDIADGTLALSIANFDGPGGDQLLYWGCAKLDVLHPDGKWVHITGPEGLEGKGMMVRSADLRTNLQATLKMEKIPGGG